MKKFKILIPVYNDWESLIKLLNEINKEVQGLEKAEFHCVIVNDASTIKPPEIKVPENIKTLKIINMKQNRGHARCNAFAIRHFSKEDSNFEYLIVMDGDGEDRPVEIKMLVKKGLSDENTSVVANRIKRSEGLFFQTSFFMTSPLPTFDSRPRLPPPQKKEDRKTRTEGAQLEDVSKRSTRKQEIANKH